MCEQEMEQATAPFFYFQLAIFSFAHYQKQWSKAELISFREVLAFPIYNKVY